MANRSDVTRQLSIFINDKQVVNSLGGVTRALSATNNQIRNLDRSSATFEQDLARLSAQSDELRERQAALREEIDSTTDSLGAASGAFSNLFTGLSSGNLPLAAQGLTGIKTAIIATTKAAWAFVSTPVGAAIAALAGVVAITKQWYDYNKELSKATQLTAAITKLTGDELDTTRQRAKAIANTFEQDFEELLNASSALVSEFGISYQEAFDSIEDGLAKGGYANEEFLESLREYPTFFAQAGYSIKEFQNLLNTGADLSIYQDKLPDAIKEFALSVNEQTTAVSEALQNAFGTQFTDRLLKGVKDGSISVKEALVLVANEAERVGLNSQQAAQLTADLFRGAGEDAGGALKIFNAVNLSLENQKRPLTELEKNFKELTAKAKEAAEAEERAFGSKGFAKWEKNFTMFFSAVKREFYDFVYVLGNGQAALDNQKANQRKAESEKRVNESNLKNYKEFLDGQKKALGERYDFEAAKAIYLSVIREKYAEATANSLANLDTREVERLNAQMKVVEKYAEKAKATTNKNNIADIKAQQEADKKLAQEREKAAKDAAKAAKAAEEKAAKEATDQAKALAKSGLDLYVANNLSKIDNDRLLTDISVKEELKRLNNIRDASLKELAVATGSNELIIALKQKQGVELNAMDQAYLAGKKKLENEAAQAIANVNQKFRKQEADYLKAKEDRQKAHNDRLVSMEQETTDAALQKLFSNADYLAEFELEKQRQRDEAKLRAAQEATDADIERLRQYELDKAVLAEASAEEIAAINARFDEQKIDTADNTEAVIAATRKKYELAQQKTGIAMLDFFIGLKNSEIKWSDMTEQQKLALTKQGLNMAADMFNKGSGAWKALKIAEAGIATAQGAINAYQSMAGIPIIGPALGAVAAGVVTAYGIKQVKEITKTKIEKQPKFFYGGYTGNKAVDNDEYGKVTGVVHDGEYVIPKAMLQVPEVARTAEWLEAKRTGSSSATGTIAPPAPGGGAAAPDSNDKEFNNTMQATLQAILYRLDNPVAPNLVMGYQEVESINKMSSEIDASGNYGQLNE